jgi:4-amino-4-deoxy-L-arabinose transferase-like glycosyltransferase
LRWPTLADQSIAFDESFSLAVGQADWPLLFQAILSDGVHPPLFYTLHKVALALYGSSEFGQRFMAAAFSLLGLPLIYQLGRRLAGPLVGLLAMLLLTLNPLHIWLAQEARMYSLFSALVTLSMLVFWQALHSQHRRYWLALALVNALIFGIHYFGLLVPVIQFSYLLLTFQHHHRSLRPWTFSQVAAGLLLLPWLIFTALRPVQSFGIGFLERPDGLDLPLTWWNLTTGISDSGWLALLTLVCYGTAIGLALLVRPPLTRQTLKRPYLLLLLWAMLPLLLVWLMSQRRSFYADRYFSFCIPALLLLAAYGAMRPSRPPWRAVIAGGLILATGLGLLVMAQSPAYQKDDWRGAAAYVSAHLQPDDAVLLRSLHIKFAFDYYYTGLSELLPVTVNLEEYEIDPLVAGAKRAWLVFPYTRRPTHYPMQPPTAASVWNLDTAKLPLLRRWFAAHKSAIIDNQRFLGVQIWLIDLTKQQK